MAYGHINITCISLPLFVKLVNLKFCKNSLVGRSVSPIPETALQSIFSMCILLKQVQFYIFPSHILYTSSCLKLHTCYYIYNTVILMIFGIYELILFMIFFTWTLLEHFLLLKQTQMYISTFQMLNNNSFQITNIPQNFYFTVLSYTYNYLTDSQFMKTCISLTHSYDQMYSHLYNSNIIFIAVETFNLSEYFTILVNV